MVSRFVKFGLCAGLLSLSPLLLAAPVAAQSFGSPLTGLLGKASDSALTKLAQPGAFMRDDAVRIMLPGPLRKMSGLMKFADQSGVTSGLSKSINDAAGMAADAAKPIFRSAISNISLKDAPAIVGKSDGATQYLRTSAGAALAARIRPLVASALGRTGAFAQLDKVGASGMLSSAGISRDGLTGSVTDQTMNGIFKYMGTEEARMRSDPMSVGKKLFGGLGH